MICDFSYNTKHIPYKSYKAEQFNKKLEKQRQLLNSILDTSLKPEDKALLKTKLKELFL